MRAAFRARQKKASEVRRCDYWLASQASTALPPSRKEEVLVVEVTVVVAAMAVPGAKCLRREAPAHRVRDH
eukprot:5640518-Pleurochrysis_carterae.AAC.5